MLQFMGLQRVGHDRATEQHVVMGSRGRDERMVGVVLLRPALGHIWLTVAVFISEVLFELI